MALASVAVGEVVVDARDVRDEPHRCASVLPVISAAALGCCLDVVVRGGGSAEFPDLTLCLPRTPRPDVMAAARSYVADYR
jgi:hypothetical protein